MDSGCDYPIIAALIFGIWWIIVLLFLWFMVGITKQEGEYEINDTGKKDRRIAYRRRTVSDLKAIERKRRYAKVRSKKKRQERTRISHAIYREHNIELK